MAWYQFGRGAQSERSQIENLYSILNIMYLSIAGVTEGTPAHLPEEIQHYAQHLLAKKGT